MGVHTVKIAVRLQQRERAFRTDPLHARDIIGTVAHQRLELNDLPRFNTFVLRKIILCKAYKIAHAALRKANAHVFADELIGISVARIDKGIDALEFFRERSDEIVCLVPLFFNDTDIHRTEQVFQNGHLHDKFFRHRFTRTLVIRI